MGQWTPIGLIESRMLQHFGSILFQPNGFSCAYGPW